MNQQAQSYEWVGMFAGIIVLFGVVGMVRTMGHFFEPPDRGRKKLPEPIAKVVTVPGGAEWKCIKCDVELKAGEKAVKIGAKTYCVPCARGGNPGSADWLPLISDDDVLAHIRRKTGISIPEGIVATLEPIESASHAYNIASFLIKVGSPYARSMLEAALVQISDAARVGLVDKIVIDYTNQEHRKITEALQVGDTMAAYDVCMDLSILLDVVHSYELVGRAGRS